MKILTVYPCLRLTSPYYSFMRRSLYSKRKVKEYQSTHRLRRTFSLNIDQAIVQLNVTLETKPQDLTGTLQAQWPSKLCRTMRRTDRTEKKQQPKKAEQDAEQMETDGRMTDKIIRAKCAQKKTDKTRRKHT